jgi:hypothetical protein
VKDFGANKISTPSIKKWPVLTVQINFDPGDHFAVAALVPAAI